MVIYHLVPQSYHIAQSPAEPYRPATFAEEGFIHCTAEPEVLLEIANLYFTGLDELLLVYTIDEERLTSPLKYEPPAQVAGAEDQPGPADDTLFPHIYGPLNREAILEVGALKRDSAGRWVWPKS
jgi:uncharacterized protein (DUF952 family)